jgi:hypothetical protein
MSAGLKILLIALVSFFLGCAAFVGVVSGPLAILASPLFAVFGWFYFPMVLLAAAVLWAIYSPTIASIHYSIIFIAISSIFGAVLMALIGSCEQGATSTWTGAYIAAGAAVGFVSSLLVTQVAKV